jgi:hypothetical protein
MQIAIFTKNKNLIFLKSDNITFSQFESNRNKRSQARECLSHYLNKISISSMDSVRMQLGMLSMITSQTNELNRKTQVYDN